MIWRIRGREGFDRLRAEGRRARGGPVQVVAALDPGAAPPRVAFAIGRAAGGSVARNRIRRRLRAVLVDLARGGDLPCGWYLVSARPEAATCPTVDLRRSVRDAVIRATRP